MALKYNLIFYADDKCLGFPSENIKDIKKQLNEDFSNICDCFIDNKLTTYLAKDKIKAIHYALKHTIKKVIKKVTI